MVRREAEQRLLASLALLDKALELAEGEEKMAEAYGPVLRADREAVATAAKAAPYEDWDPLLLRLSQLPALSAGWEPCASTENPTGRTGERPTHRGEKTG